LNRLYKFVDCAFYVRYNSVSGAVMQCSIESAIALNELCTRLFSHPEFEAIFMSTNDEQLVGDKVYKLVGFPEHHFVRIMNEMKLLEYTDISDFVTAAIFPQGEERDIWKIGELENEVFCGIYSEIERLYELVGQLHVQPEVVLEITRHLKTLERLNRLFPRFRINDGTMF